jgi:hypothetical protein
MTVNDLYRDHFKRLVTSFGVANALSAYRDNRISRALGDSKEPVWVPLPATASVGGL